MGAALVAAPFFIKIAPVMTQSASWLFFIKIFSVLSVCLWGLTVKRKEVLIATVLVIGACFVTTDAYERFSFVQMETALFSLLFFAFIMGQKIDRSTVYKALGISCLLQSAWLFLNYLGHDPFSWWLSIFIDFKRESHGAALSPHGPLGHIDHSAALVAITIPFLKKRFWVIPLAAVLISQTALPIVCAIMVGLFTVAQKYNKVKYVWLSVIGLAVVSSMFDTSMIGTNNRLNAWLAFMNWHEFNFFGHGFGYIVKFGEFYKSTGHPELFYQLHNELLETYAVFGIPGLIGLAFLLKPLLLKNEYGEAYTALSVGLVNCLGNFSMHVAPIFITICVCYALVITGAKKWQHQQVERF